MTCHEHARVFPQPGRHGYMSQLRHAIRAQLVMALPLFVAGLAHAQDASTSPTIWKKSSSPAARVSEEIRKVEVSYARHHHQWRRRCAWMRRSVSPMRSVRCRASGSNPPAVKPARTFVRAAFLKKASRPWAWKQRWPARAARSRPRLVERRSIVPPRRHHRSHRSGARRPGVNVLVERARRRRELHHS